VAASNPRQQATRPSAWCGSLALWQSGSLAVWHMFLTTSRPRCSTSLQHRDARPRDAEAAATRFRTTGAFLSSPRIAPGHQVLPSRFVQTPPSALCTLHSATFNIATVCGTFGHLSLPSSLVRGLGRNSSSVLLRGKVPPYGVQPAKTRRRVPKRSSCLRQRHMAREGIRLDLHLACEFKPPGYQDKYSVCLRASLHLPPSSGLGMSLHPFFSAMAQNLLSSHLRTSSKSPPPRRFSRS
jgi:hypothetical protein